LSDLIERALRAAEQHPNDPQGGNVGGAGKVDRLV